MMGSLLEVNRTPIDPALVGFTENRVEGFFHCQVDERTSDPRSGNKFDLVLDFRVFSGLFEVDRVVSKRHRKSLDVALDAKYINRKGNVEYTLSTENVPADSLNNVGQHFLLLFHLFFVDVGQPSSGEDIPFSLP